MSLNQNKYLAEHLQSVCELKIRQTNFEFKGDIVNKIDSNDKLNKTICFLYKYNPSANIIKSNSQILTKPTVNVKIILTSKTVLKGVGKKPVKKII